MFTSSQKSVSFKSYKKSRSLVFISPDGTSTERQVTVVLLFVDSDVLLKAKDILFTWTTAIVFVCSKVCNYERISMSMRMNRKRKNFDKAQKFVSYRDLHHTQGQNCDVIGHNLLHEEVNSVAAALCFCIVLLKIPESWLVVCCWKFVVRSIMVLKC